MLTVRVELAWWFVWLYVPGVMLACLVCGTQPNLARVAYWAEKALRVRV